MKTGQQDESNPLSVQRHALALAFIMALLALSACTSWQVPEGFDVTALRARAESEAQSDVRLSAAVLSSSESRQMFGVDVNRTGVQPVWVEVDNTTDQVLWLLRSGTDPDLFSPHEVAWSFRKTFDREHNDRLEQHFNNLSFQNPVAPGTTVSGILFTNPHHSTRLLSIDILGQGALFPFTLFLHVPDDVSSADAPLDRVNELIAATGTDYTDADALRAALEQLPCCASSSDGTAAGDPINVILVGNIDNIAAAFVRRGFRSDALDYDNAQHLYGRPPDIVARKAGQGGVPANWVRMWVAPFSYRGRSVLLAQAGRPLGWRLAVRENEELQLNPSVDEVRNLLIQDLMYSYGLEKLAFVTGVGASAAGETRDSLGNDSYHTDGLRAVLFLTIRPLSLSDLQILDWYPALKLRELDAAREHPQHEQ